MSTYQEILDRVQTLTPDEQKRLLKDLTTLIHQQGTAREPTTRHQPPKLNLSQWRGFLPRRVEPLDFQLQLRQEWDD